MTPTMNFRWYIKYVPAPHLGENISERKKVLQQMFIGSLAHEIWQDVPTVDSKD